MVRLVIGVVLVAALAARCGGAPSSPAGPSPAASSAAPAATVSPGAASAGCADGPALARGEHLMSFGGLQRRFLLSLPAGPGPHPVLLNLHGMGSNAAEQAVYSRLPDVGARRGYIVATPQSAEGRFGWTLPHTGGPDDTGFLGALLDRLGQGLCVDPRRQFAAGMSLGAGMSAGLVCALNGRLAGVGLVAGVNIVRPCDDPRPTTIIAFHGVADRVVPYQGGAPLQVASEKLRKLGALVTLPPVEQAAGGWARALGCTGRADTTAARGVRLRGWTSCRGGVTVRLYTVRDGGHTWPGARQVPRLGATTRALDATGVILDAFDAAPSR
ncbi:alpha/beta hydrolase family esterase [Nonomuraea cavernae]|uniref:alpha/beta hydrolase family esterase n=1 Tax=Nonomuraea cavernae TaxID=2045107 RepID=UPI0033E292AB